MDPQVIQLLAQLMSQAKSGNRNVSSLGNNLSDPVILALAGVLDPYYGQSSSSGELYSQFANDPSTPPAVKAVMDYVDQGMNGYQIEAQINKLDGSVKTDSGYTDEQLISMGREMAKERSKAKSSNAFEKAGLRNPNDIYTLNDIPLTADQQSVYAKYLDKAGETQKRLDNADYAIRVAQQRAKDNEGIPTIEDITARSGGVGLNMPENYMAKSMAEAAKNAPENYIAKTMGVMPENYMAKSMAEAAKNAPENYMAKSMAEAAKNAEPNYMAQSMGQGSKKSQQKLMDINDADAIARAIAQKADLDTIMQGDLMRAQAVKKGALKRAAESGRTPFTDQASALLRFIAGTK